MSATSSCYCNQLAPQQLHTRNIGKSCLILFKQAALIAQETWQLLKLCTTQGGIQVGQPVVETHLVMHKIPAMRQLGRCRDVFGPFAQFDIIGQDGPTATCGDGLVAIETQGAHQPKSTSVLPAHGAAQGFGGVFDQLQVEVMCYSQKRIYIDRMPKVCIGTMARMTRPVLRLTH
jgi:hypothetical protein